MSPVAIGCMRLSIVPERDDTRGIEVLHAALDSGVTLLDTADAYCLDDADVGHNERLIARALATWSGDRSGIVVATKGGLTRPNGEWVANGKARHLRHACEASLRALGTERIQLYQLHAPDPRTPLATSVRALASLKDEGLIERVGLSNVNVGQIEEARRICEIATVQIELNVWHDQNVLNGVVPYCIGHGIQVLAYRPVAGARRHRLLSANRALSDVAVRHGATAQEIALAWLHDLSDAIVAIPGPTRPETVRSIVGAHRLMLSDEDRARLDAEFPSGAMVRSSSNRDTASATPTRDGEIVLVMGLPGAGKSTVAQGLVAEGYARLNRDESGGTLRDLLPELERLVNEGRTRIVLDNTYTSRASRARVVRAAEPLGLPVKCVWVATSIEAAQVNAAWRMVSKYGRLLGPDEMRQIAKRDVTAFPPRVQFRHQREFEPPDPSEGFSRIETVPFERTHDASNNSKAVIAWFDATWSAQNEGALVERGAVFRRYQESGWRLLGLSWRPEISDKTLTHEQVDAGFMRLQEMLGVSIEVLYCPHAGGPPICWCRKPLPGLGVVFILRHQLDPGQCIYVGSGPQDPGFARRLGFRYREASEFFAASAGADSLLIP
jgi:aryl-alcohol dehydrogenase-like predicted oxidoreductase